MSSGHHVNILGQLRDDDNLNEPLNPQAHKDVDPETLQVMATGDEGLTTQHANNLMAEWGPNALPENKKSKASLLTPTPWPPAIGRGRHLPHLGHTHSDAARLL